MKLTAQLANHVRAAHFGGNYTGVNLKDNLTNITWQQTTKQIYSLNTIAALVFHMNYYISAVLKVLQGGPLDAHDKYSYDCPPIQSQEDWEQLQNRVFAEAETFAAAIEQMPDEKLEEAFIDGKYGTYYRNIAGSVEHFHYHLGQISLIKKILMRESTY